MIIKKYIHNTVLKFTKNSTEYMQNMYNNYEAMLGEISKDLSKGEGAWGNFLGRQNCFVS